MRRKEVLKIVHSFFARLSPRERFILGGGAAAVFLLVGYFVFAAPLLDRMEALDRLIPQKEKEVREFIRLKEEYQGLSKIVEKIEGRLPSRNQFSPLSFLEERAAKNQIRGNIAYIRPLAPQVREPYHEIPVEVRMENVTLAQMVPFLASVEAAPYYLRIKRLSMKTRFSDPSYLDATFVVSSYEKGAS
ncbi:MAG TPA: type II secretion system protein GspM [Candidatus Manganitrophaceae bacterium]